MFYKWTQGAKPDNGSLLQLVTKEGVTEIVKVWAAWNTAHCLQHSHDIANTQGGEFTDLSVLFVVTQ